MKYALEVYIEKVDGWNEMEQSNDSRELIDKAETYYFSDDYRIRDLSSGKIVREHIEVKGGGD